MAKVMSRTSAPPRAPDASLREPRDVGVKPTMKVVFSGTAKDSKNKMVPVQIEEMPLPHVYYDLNVRKSRDDKGADTIG